MKELHPLAGFDPPKLAQFERDNYVAYYQKRWPKLLRCSVGMVREAYRLSLPQAVYGAYLVARAEIAFAPFPENDRPLAEAYMRRFFGFLRRVHRLELDVQRSAALELRWWEVHRQLFGQSGNEPLVQALVDSYAAFYGQPAARFLPAATARAEGMLLSDRWVTEGKDPGSPLLEQEVQALCRGYTALKAALSG